MSKLLKDLVPGDIIYMLSEGTTHGKLHLYEYRVERGFTRNEKISQWLDCKLENYPFEIHITDEWLDKDNFGNMIITDLDAAKKAYISRAEDILKELGSTIEEAKKELIQLLSWEAKISATAEELQFEQEHQVLYNIWVEQGKSHFEPTKTYDIEEDDTNV